MFVDEAHELTFQEGILASASTDMAKARVSSELQYEGFKDAGCVRLLSSRFLKNRKALHAWDLNALDSRLRDLIEVGEVMGKSKKKTGSRKGTITAFVVALMRKRMGTNKDTIAKVAKAFPDSRWNVEGPGPGSLLGWHKSEFRKGKRWDGGKKQVIDQPETGRSAKKAAKKKGVKKVARKKGRKKATRKKVRRATK
ncbi:MAG: hypothetical protein V3S43_03530 [Acidimicrobiia bacterium]